MSAELTTVPIGLESADTLLEQLEQQIDDRIAMAVATFDEVGRLLRRIRDQRLYKARFASFEGYLRERWGIARRTGYRYIEAADLVENVSHGTHFPGNERQARELGRLPEPEQQRAAWNEVIELAEGKAITAAQVRRVIENRSAVREGRAPASRISALPTGCFDVLYADPPWQYDFMRVDAWAVENTYPTMDVAALCALADQVQSISAPTSVLFLWATSPKLREAHAVMAAWGFDYKSSMVWIKHRNQAGMGYWTRVGHEFLLIGAREKAAPPPPERRFPSVIEAPKGAHSAKPEEARAVIEQMFPNATRLELFARGAPPDGWTFWGNETLEGENNGLQSKAGDDSREG